MLKRIHNVLVVEAIGDVLVMPRVRELVYGKIAALKRQRLRPIFEAVV